MEAHSLSILVLQIMVSEDVFVAVNECIDVIYCLEAFLVDKLLQKRQIDLVLLPECCQAVDCWRSQRLGDRLQSLTHFCYDVIYKDIP